ncbi:MAG: hypothetical protein M1814_006855 [Vezdaea aestivalis]|nr:MAG: hypothetical protein M1814_006855 [Vezdaea aestivalis]
MPPKKKLPKVQPDGPSGHKEAEAAAKKIEAADAMSAAAKAIKESRIAANQYAKAEANFDGPKVPREPSTPTPRTQLEIANKAYERARKWKKTVVERATETAIAALEAAAIAEEEKEANLAGQEPDENEGKNEGKQKKKDEFESEDEGGETTWTPSQVAQREKYYTNHWLGGSFVSPKEEPNRAKAVFEARVIQAEANLERALDQVPLLKANVVEALALRKAARSDVQVFNTAYRLQWTRTSVVHNNKQVEYWTLEAKTARLEKRKLERSQGWGSGTDAAKKKRAERIKKKLKQPDFVERYNKREAEEKAKAAEETAKKEAANEKRRRTILFQQKAKEDERKANRQRIINEKAAATRKYNAEVKREAEKKKSEADKKQKAKEKKDNDEAKKRKLSDSKDITGDSSQPPPPKKPKTKDT